MNLPSILIDLLCKEMDRVRNVFSYTVQETQVVLLELA